MTQNSNNLMMRLTFGLIFLLLLLVGALVKKSWHPSQVPTHPSLSSRTLPKATESMITIQRLKLGTLAGTQGPVLTIFVSPDCLYCMEFYTHLRPMIDEGKIRVRYLVVGGDDEFEQASGVVASPQPLTELAYYFVQNFQVDPNKLGIPPDSHYVFSKPTEQAKDQVLNANNILASNTQGSLLTPSMLVCDAKGVHFMAGELEPNELMSMLTLLPASKTPCG